jgi:hypothetical protein
VKQISPSRKALTNVVYSTSYTIMRSRLAIKIWTSLLVKRRLIEMSGNMLLQSQEMSGRVSSQVFLVKTAY